MWRGPVVLRFWSQLGKVNAFKALYQASREGRTEVFVTTSPWEVKPSFGAKSILEPELPSKKICC